MAIEKQETHVPQIGFALIPKQYSFHYNKTDDFDSMTCSSLDSRSSSTDAIIIDSDNDKPGNKKKIKKKKVRVGSWRKDVKVFNELSCVFKGLPDSTAKGNDVVSRVDSWLSSTYLHEQSSV
ncbi:hypothetical protein EUTSA_v10019677mg [Eutrema salsugineum]|uniref:Uncharacterized protein n=1 Tax=Eutrema salsugineum TaxID=72664 RepID=V4KKN2_EUTSA|nr:hypothetical protein EUTSA_v10019677mg [Eutrema salsugineum]